MLHLLVCLRVVIIVLECFSAFSFSEKNAQLCTNTTKKEKIGRNSSGKKKCPILGVQRSTFIMLTASHNSLHFCGEVTS